MRRVYAQSERSEGAAHPPVAATLSLSRDAFALRGTLVEAALRYEGVLLLMTIRRDKNKYDCVDGNAKSLHVLLNGKGD